MRQRQFALRLKGILNHSGILLQPPDGRPDAFPRSATVSLNVSSAARQRENFTVSQPNCRYSGLPCGMAATAIVGDGQGSRSLYKDEPMLHRFKISAEKMFWVMAAGAVAIPVLVIVYETNFGPAAGH